MGGLARSLGVLRSIPSPTARESGASLAHSLGLNGAPPHTHRNRYHPTPPLAPGASIDHPPAIAIAIAIALAIAARG